MAPHKQIYLCNVWHFQHHTPLHIHGVDKIMDYFQKSQNCCSTGDSRTDYSSWKLCFHTNCLTWASQYIAHSTKGLSDKTTFKHNSITAQRSGLIIISFTSLNHYFHTFAHDMVCKLHYATHTSGKLSGKTMQSNLLCRPHEIQLRLLFI
jgi:hypothetical protein